MIPRIVVVKIGGSLFTQTQFVVRLRAWTERLITQLSPVHVVFVTGGGPLVEGLREIDRTNAIPEECSHWLAIHLMDVNARLLSQWWPDLLAERSLVALRNRIAREGMTLFLVERFLVEEEPSLTGTPLPVGWDVSSDSIAARLSHVLGADRLVLLKSVPGIPGANWDQAANEGLVDPFFPNLATQIAEVQIACLEGS